MREIKFRGKDKATGEWVYGYYVVWEEDTSELVECIWQLGSKRATPIEQKTRSQYTGLKDKNGMEIYEGDILPFGYIVTFLDTNDNAALGMPIGWYDQKDDFEKYREICVGDEIKIIGNIYEHPELLEEEEKC